MKGFGWRVRWYFFLANIRHWFWWRFKATEAQKVATDMFYYGTGIMKNGKRIDPNKFNYPN